MGFLDRLRSFFSADDSSEERRRRAEAQRDRLVADGLAEEVLLLPEEFGGPTDHPGNIIYLPTAAVELKRQFDAEVAKKLEQGEEMQYQATPEYDNDSFIPAKLMLQAIGNTPDAGITATLDLRPFRTWEDDAPPDDTEFRSFVERSMEELRAKTSAHDALWHLSEADWDVDQERGVIRFTRSDGLVAECPVQIVGTYDTTDGTWLWGWDHPSVEPPLQQHAAVVKSYGKEHGIEKLVTRKVNCTEDEAWEFAAVACKLAEAQGAYRGPSGSTLVFMTYGEVKLSQDAV